MVKNRISEHQEQANFFSEVTYRFRNRDDFADLLLFSVPNGMWAGGKNPYGLIAKFKAEGFKPGVSDILYLQPRGDYAYLAIEMKAEDQRNKKDGGLKLHQQEFLQAAKANGGMTAVCYNCDEAIEVFTRYMGFSISLSS